MRRDNSGPYKKHPKNVLHDGFLMLIELDVRLQEIPEVATSILLPVALPFGDRRKQ